MHSPRSEDLESFDERQFFNFPLDGGEYDAPFAGTPSLLNQLLSPCLAPSSAGTKLHRVSAGDGDLTSLNVDENLDLFTRLINSADAPPSLSVSSRGTMSLPHITLEFLNTPYVDMQYLFSASTSTLDIYLHLFFTRFLVQVPLIHIATWKMANTPPFLVQTFHACGALFIKTPEAAAFLEATLISVEAETSKAFATINDISDFHLASAPHVHLIIALVLLQTMSMFLREGGRLSPASPQHHAMLGAIIRHGGIINRVGSWTAPNWSDAISLETAWIKWVQFATIKRALLLAYFHDCRHCMYSAAQPAFSPAELDIHLPCEDALWQASSAVEWLSAVHTPSPYGTGIERIYGANMQDALRFLMTPPSVNSDFNSASAGLPTLTPFALFLLIYTILRNIAVAQQAPLGGWSCFTLAPSGAEFTSRTQSMLDNWLSLWLASPEAAVPVQENGNREQEPPFIYNSLPFYWLAQVTLWERS
ncbi:hypothetical protein B0H19DRAFT_1252478 [Mycena capillaripes]|nr:hypothetical protein B0H19DRAFT_1252478 [Mycena capillaripes]